METDPMALEQRRIRMTRNRQRIVTASMVIHHIVSGCFYASYVVYEHDIRTNGPVKYCSPNIFIGHSAGSDLVEAINLYKIIMNLIVVVWLVVVTSILSKTVRNASDGWTLKRNNRRLLVIIWAFITVYILSSCI